MRMKRDLQNGTAKTLLIKLKQEKERLIKEKLIINQKKLNFPNEKDVPFIIPQNWIWARLFDVSIIQEGPGIRKYQYQKEGIQFLTVTNILEGAVDLEKSKKYISLKEFNDKYNHFKINKNDIVTACSGGSWGKSAIFKHDDIVILNTSTLRLRFFGDLGDNKYLYYLTKADFFKNQIADQLSGQQPNFGYSHYSRIKVPIPSLLEQKRIVKILDEVFAAIDKAKANAEKNLQNSRELFDSYLNKVFANPGEDWEEKRLGEITTKIGSGATPRGGKKSYKMIGVSLIRSLNVYDREFRKKDLALIDEEQATKLSNVTLCEGDVLLNITGASVARCCIVPSEYLPARVNQHVSIIRLKDNAISPKLLNYLLTSKVYKDKLLQTGEKGGATRQAITKSQIEDFGILFPSRFLEQQESIVNKLDDLSNETKKLESIYQQKQNDLEELKKTILQKAFAGYL